MAAGGMGEGSSGHANVFCIPRVMDNHCEHHLYVEAFCILFSHCNNLEQFTTRLYSTFINGINDDSEGDSIARAREENFPKTK